MASVTVSADLQITIPAAVGQSLGLSEGQRFQVVRYQDRIELIPIRPIQALRGFLKGMETTLDRDADRATAYQFDAIVWTQDNDFEGLRNIRYLAKT